MAKEKEQIDQLLEDMQRNVDYAYEKGYEKGYNNAKEEVIGLILGGIRNNLNIVLYKRNLEEETEAFVKFIREEIVKLIKSIKETK